MSEFHRAKKNLISFWDPNGNFFREKVSLCSGKTLKKICYKTPPSLHTKRGFQGDRGVTLGFHSSWWFNGVAWGWSAMIHPEICGIHEGRECHERHDPTAGVWSLVTAAQHANFFCLVGHVWNQIIGKMKCEPLLIKTFAPPPCETG